MNNTTKTLLTAVAIIVAVGIGYSIGTHKTESDKPLPGLSSSERKILYYRHPMGLPDTSPVPKKDSMDMDYIPVYEGEANTSAASENQIKISVEKVQKLGVKTVAAALRQLTQTVRVSDASSQTNAASIP